MKKAGAEKRVYAKVLHYQPWYSGTLAWRTIRTLPVF